MGWNWPRAHELTASYTYGPDRRPLTITCEGATYWYIYNAHGDVVAITDSTGAVKARYEYDEWGRIFALYDETGRVKEVYGTIGDIGTSPARPVIGSPTPGSTKGKKGKDSPTTLSEPDPATGDVALPAEDEGELQIQGVIGEPTDLVKMNPYRYGGYRYDRETQYYYLGARNYDGRLARFLSQDTRIGDVRNPLTLNRYIYAIGNPVNYLDPTGHVQVMILNDEKLSPTDPEKKLPNLSNMSDEALVRGSTFTQYAIAYYGIALLGEAIRHHISPEIVTQANDHAQKGRQMGLTIKDVPVPWRQDPLMRELGKKLGLLFDGGDSEIPRSVSQGTHEPAKSWSLTESLGNAWNRQKMATQQSLMLGAFTLTLGSITVGGVRDRTGTSGASGIGSVLRHPLTWIVGGLGASILADSSATDHSTNDIRTDSQKRAPFYVDANIGIAFSKTVAGNASPVEAAWVSQVTLVASRVGTPTVTATGLQEVTMKGINVLPVGGRANMGSSLTDYQLVMNTLSSYNVGGGKGFNDRRIITEAVLSIAPGETVSFASADRGVYNKLADMAGMNLASMGGVNLPFTVVISGRKMTVYPIR